MELSAKVKGARARVLYRRREVELQTGESTKVEFVSVCRFIQAGLELGPVSRPISYTYEEKVQSPLAETTQFPLMRICYRHHRAEESLLQRLTN